MSFGLELKKARTNKNLTQNDLAKELGITVHSIRKYENDSREPNIDMIIKISNVLDAPILKLLNVDENDYDKIHDLINKTGFNGTFLKDRINKIADKNYLKEFLEYVDYDRMIVSLNGFNGDLQSEIIHIWGEMLTDIFAHSYLTDEPVDATYIDDIFIKNKFFEYYNELVYSINNLKNSEDISAIQEISIKKTNLLNNISSLIDKIIIRALPELDSNSILLENEIKSDYLSKKTKQR